jgi:23S rRNA U2552 (ribose-2'-O)-methylase RlmE/FtsJ
MPVNHDLPLGKIDSCQVCGSKDLHPVLDLGHHAPCDSLIWPRHLDEAESVYPLRFLVCKSCSLGQIDHVVRPDVLFFPDYPYRSGITQTLVEKLSRTAKATLERFQLPPGALVIDIGSNDGTVLQAFKARGMKVLGVEATNIAKIANENGVETIQGFFDETTAAKIVASHGRASAMTATNVFAHVSNLGSIMRGVDKLLADGGVFVTESHYMMDLLDTVQYDSIYHEHLRYYTVRSIVALFDQYGFSVVDVERIDNYGGSIRVFAVKGKGLAPKASVVELLALEESRGLYGTEVYAQFARRTLKAKRDLLALVVKLTQEGHSVPGIGCPGRSATLVNFTGLGPDLMPYIAEQSTSLKLGLFLPGKHVPIVDERRLFDEQPEYAVMLSWHYAKPIIAKLRQRGLRSKIIVPLPEVTIDHP